MTNVSTHCYTGHKTIKPIIISIIITGTDFIHAKTTSRCYYGAGAGTETEKSMEEDRPSSENLLLQMVNAEANVSRHGQHHKVSLIKKRAVAGNPEPLLGSHHGPVRPKQAVAN